MKRVLLASVLVIGVLSQDGGALASNEEQPLLDPPPSSIVSVYSATESIHSSPKIEMIVVTDDEEEVQLPPEKVRRKEGEKTQKSTLQNLSQVYFQGIANDLAGARMISSIFPNMSDMGDVRENILLKFLQTHLPSRCSVVKGGFVFDSMDRQSKQIDILVVNDASLRFSYFERDSHNNKTIQTVEGCLAAISVKSTLDKAQLLNALDNLASIPPIPSSMLQRVNPLLQRRETYLEFPKKIVFAYSGLSIQTIYDHVQEFYRTTSHLPYQKADIIVVNNSYFIMKVGKEGAKTVDGSTLDEGQYHGVYDKNNQDKFGALPLFSLLLEIQKTTMWGPSVLLDYQPYMRAMQLHAMSS